MMIYMFQLIITYTQRTTLKLSGLKQQCVIDSCGSVCGCASYRVFSSGVSDIDLVTWQLRVQSFERSSGD